MGETKKQRSPLTTLCYIEKDDSYLMLHRIKKKQDVNEGKWIGVGGHFEENESPENCLLREVKEETGLTDFLALPRNRRLSRKVGRRNICACTRRMDLRNASRMTRASLPGWRKRMPALRPLGRRRTIF
ncbi:NUDIX domain-containing protein [Clostridium sp.]|uniref:NUDIX domain-containing protein n=1 Tax=Clostridium sp. TaxID=1506 RepID=UPI00339044ED